MRLVNNKDPCEKASEEITLIPVLSQNCFRISVAIFLSFWGLFFVHHFSEHLTPYIMPIFESSTLDDCLNSIL